MIVQSPVTCTYIYVVLLYSKWSIDLNVLDPVYDMPTILWQRHIDYIIKLLNHIFPMLNIHLRKFNDLRSVDMEVLIIMYIVKMYTWKCTNNILCKHNDPDLAAICFIITPSFNTQLNIVATYQLFMYFKYSLMK